MACQGVQAWCLGEEGSEFNDIPPEHVLRLFGLSRKDLPLAYNYWSRSEAVSKASSILSLIEQTQQREDVPVGSRVRWNDRDWEVVVIKKAMYHLKSKGLPLQKMSYLRLNQLVDDGKVRIL